MEEQNIKLHKALRTAFLKCDIEAIVACVAEDCVVKTAKGDVLKSRAAFVKELQNNKDTLKTLSEYEMPVWIDETHSKSRLRVNFMFMSFQLDEVIVFSKELGLITKVTRKVAEYPSDYEDEDEDENEEDGNEEDKVDNGADESDEDEQNNEDIKDKVMEETIGTAAGINQDKTLGQNDDETEDDKEKAIAKEENFERQDNHDDDAKQKRSVDNKVEDEVEDKQESASKKLKIANEETVDTS